MAIRLLKPARAIVTLAIVAQVLVLVPGCYSYAVRLKVTGKDAQRPCREDPQGDALLQVVGTVAQNFALVPVPNLAALQERSAQEDNFYFRVSAEWVTKPGAAPGVLVIVGQDKTDHGFLVLVRAARESSEVEFVRDLKNALAAAITKSFPSCDIEVERLYDTPSFYVP